MKISTCVQRRIDNYDASHQLGHTAKIFLALCGINHEDVKGHVERVALLCESTATKLGKDAKAAFFAGLLHDVGKLVLPANLFDGHNIDAKEYEKVKTHALAGFEGLKELHAFTALCAGLHHTLYSAGYGLTIKDFPKDWNLATIKKVLEISAVVSICDFVDAFTHRKTKIKDGSDSAGPSLREMLQKKYPEDHQVIEIVLHENEKQLIKES